MCLYGANLGSNVDHGDLNKRLKIRVRLRALRALWSTQLCFTQIYAERGDVHSLAAPFVTSESERDPAVNAGMAGITGGMAIGKDAMAAESLCSQVNTNGDLELAVL